MNLATYWLRVRCSHLLLSAKWRVAAGNFESARGKALRIFALCEASGAQVPIMADIMRALVAWNLADYSDTAIYVNSASRKLSNRLGETPNSQLQHELHYLRAYCWTLLYYSEAAGAEVQWEYFSELLPASDVNLAQVSRTTREMFPVDEEVFAPARPH